MFKAHKFISSVKIFPAYIIIAKSKNLAQVWTDSPIDMLHRYWLAVPPSHLVGVGGSVLDGHLRKRTGSMLMEQRGLPKRFTGGWGWS